MSENPEKDKFWDMEFVEELIKFVTNPILKKLLDTLGDNPKVFSSIIKTMDNQEVTTHIKDVFDGKNSQQTLDLIENYKAFLAALFSNDALSCIQTIANDIGIYYNEFAMGDSAFPNYQLKKTENPNIKSKNKTDISPIIFPWLAKNVYEIKVEDIVDPEKIQSKDMFEYDIADLAIAKDSSSEYQSQIDIIDTASYFLLNSIWQYSPSAIKKFQDTLHPEQLQYKICNDFLALENREKELLSQQIINNYSEKAKILSAKLKNRNITHFSLFHRNILDWMIQQNQKEKPLEETFYYFTMGHNQEISLSHRSFKEHVYSIIDDDALLDPLEKDPKKQIRLKDALQDLDKERTDNQESRQPMSDVWIQKRSDISVQLPQYVQKILAWQEVNNLMPKYSHFPASIIESEWWCIIPIPITWIPNGISSNVFFSLFPDFSLPNCIVPRGFNVGYLLRGSSVKITDTNIDLSQWFTDGDVYPVFIYDEVAIVLHNLFDLKELEQWISGDLPHMNDISHIAPPQFTELIEMFHTMSAKTAVAAKQAEMTKSIETEKNILPTKPIQITNDWNIYRHIISRTKGSIRTPFREKYDPKFGWFKWEKNYAGYQWPKL